MRRGAPSVPRDLASRVFRLFEVRVPLARLPYFNQTREALAWRLAFPLV